MNSNILKFITDKDHFTAGAILDLFDEIVEAEESKRPITTSKTPSTKHHWNSPSKHSSSNEIQQLLDIIDPRYCDMSNGFSYKVFSPTIDGKQMKKRGFFGLKPLVSNTFVSDELDVF